MDSYKLGIIGGGSWGAALAALAAKRCQEVHWWFRSFQKAQLFHITKRHEKFENFIFPQNVHATSDLAFFFRQSFDVLIIAVPSVAFREVLIKIAPFILPNQKVIHVTKGLENNTCRRMSEILQEYFPSNPIGVLGGPNLAFEIIEQKPSGAILASKSEEIYELSRSIFHQPGIFSLHSSEDVLGVELGGVLKNVYTLGVALLDGAQQGLNFKSCFLLQAILEMQSFYKAFQANTQTLYSLAGVSDFFATSLSTHSRNYQLGWRLGETGVLDSTIMAEGLYSIQSVWELSRLKNMHTPLLKSMVECFLQKGDVQDFIQTVFDNISC